MWHLDILIFKCDKRICWMKNQFIRVCTGSPQGPQLQKWWSSQQIWWILHFNGTEGNFIDIYINNWYKCQFMFKMNLTKKSIWVDWDINWLLYIWMHMCVFRDWEKYQLITLSINLKGKVKNSMCIGAFRDWEKDQLIKISIEIERKSEN